MNSSRKFFLFFALLFLGRLVFSLTIGLIDDEAYHWSWAKEVSLSYFDHPGMIAWIEWLTTHLFGDTILAVRLPAYILFSASTYLLWKITSDMFDQQSAFYATMLILFSPFFGFGGFVSSPEQPFMFFWLSGVSVFWKYASDQWTIRKSWIYLGLIMGLGLNSKFIIATLAFGFGVFMLIDTKKRKDLRSPWPWFGFVIATILCFPIFAWNSIYEWPGFKYQFHDRHQGEHLSITRWSVFLLIQIGILTPVIFFLVGKTWLHSLTHLKELKWRFLFCLTIPTLAIFYTQPLFAEYKPHWSGSAYLTLFIGAGFLWSKSSKRGLITKCMLVTLVPLNLIIYSPFLYPWWPKAHRFLAPRTEWQTTNDLSNEFHGWEELGQRLIQIQNETEGKTGKRPFLASHRYETTAQTYWGSKQKTYMLAKVVSHYTVVQRNEIDALHGFDSLFITTEKYGGTPLDYAKWDSCTPEKFDFVREDELSRQFTIWHCQNFQGIL